MSFTNEWNEFKKKTTLKNPTGYFDEEKQRKIKEAVTTINAAAPVVEAVGKPVVDLAEKAFDSLFGSKKDREEKDGDKPGPPPKDTPDDTKKNKIPSRDTRLDGIYDTVHQIGNNMPKGEQFMGIPSLMNQHALIRFEGIAGSDEHINVYDFVGNFKVRNSRVYNLVFDVDNVDLEKYGFIKNSDGTVTFNNNANGVEKDKAKYIEETYGIKNDEKLQVDEAGQIFYYDENKSTVVFKFKGSKDDEKIDGQDELMITGGGDDDKKSGKDVVFGYHTYDSNGKGKGIVKVEPDFGGNGNTGNNIYLLAEQCLGLTPAPEGAVTVDEDRRWTSLEYIQLKAAEQKGGGGANIDTESIKTNLAPKVIQVEKLKYYSCEGYLKTKHYISRDAGQSNVSQQVLEPTTENLCNSDLWVGDEQFMYEWTDFMYCTYNDVISNNYLITLRRFPKPVWDSGKSVNQDVQKDFMAPIAKAVTWTTDDENKLSEILKQTWGYKWKDLEASVNEVRDQSKDQGNDIPGGSKLGKLFEFINDGGNAHTRGVQHDKAQLDPYKDGPMANQPMGPVNSITKTKTRDIGLEYTNNITLKFHYSLYSMGAINAGKAALDIIANMLSLTYSNAGFWGGANRFFKNVHGNYFSNDQKMMKAFNAGDFGGMLSSFKNELDTALGNIGSFLSDLVSDPKKALMGLLNKGAKYGLQTMAAKNRPGVIAVKSVLTGEPIGDWHLVIGNPFNPIAMIGNLIVKSCDFEFVDGQLGVDDFPHEMIFTVTLEHGKPRDKGDIESMFNKGQGKLHYAYKGEQQPWDIPVDTRIIERRGKLISKDYELSKSGTDSSKNQTVSRVTTKRHPINDSLFINRKRTKTDVKTQEQYWSSIYSRVKSKNIAGAVNAYKLAGQLGQKDLNEDKPPVDDNGGTGNGSGGKGGDSN